jgi:peroxiredoxin
MDAALLIARLLLAGAFAVSGIAKLVDRQGSRKAIEDFGVPARLASVGGIALPLVELVVAALLLPQSTAWWGALGALGLLLVFISGITYNLAKGRRPDCHCFGQLYSEPIGWRTLVRDAALAAVAGFVLVGGWSDSGPSTIAWLGDLTTGETVAVVLSAVALALVAVQSGFLIHMLGRSGRVMVRLDAVEAQVRAGAGNSATTIDGSTPVELPEGTLAPAFQLEGLYGETMTLDALRSSDKPVLLVFTDPNCSPCNNLMPELGQWQREFANRLTFAVIGCGTVEANRAKTVEHGLTNVLLQRDREVAEAYQARPTPSGVLVRADGTIGSPVAGGVAAIRQLVATVTHVPIPAEATIASHGLSERNGAVGDAAISTPTIAAPESDIVQLAPSVILPDLDGKEVSISDFRGQPTLVLFWNPSCGYCQRMADELKTWEAALPEGAPKVLVVSTGTVDANKAMGLASTVVLDESFATGRAFGATATPSAVLVDADGKIASSVILGASRVMALANGAEPQSLVSQEPRVPSGPQRSPIPATPLVEKGDPVPTFKLSDLDGEKVNLANRTSQPRALLFWDPACGFCQQMVDWLKEWEEHPPVGAPQVVLVSEGSSDANREFGLRSRILLDDDRVTRQAFAATGTPSAVLIDAEGRIASDIVAGGRAVLNLIGYDSVACQRCIDECRQRGGGDACQTVCQMGGQCD